MTFTTDFAEGTAIFIAIIVLALAYVGYLSVPAVPAPIVWTRFCNSGRLSHGMSLTDFKG